MNTIETVTKSELLDILRADNEQGIAFNQSGIPLQVMTYREFLDWFANTGHDRYIIEEVEVYDEDQEEYVTKYHLNRTLSGGKYIGHEEYDTEDDARDEYYEVMERRYNDDNGSGGIFYPNAEAIARLEDDKDEWQSLLAKEPLYMVIEYTTLNTTSYLNGVGTFGLREYAVYYSENEAQAHVKKFVQILAANKLKWFPEDEREDMRELVLQEASRFYTIEEVEEEETEA